MRSDSPFLQAMTMLYTNGYNHVGGMPLFRQRAEKEQRPCINCGTMKRHNNSFCSAKCCREYKQNKGAR